MKIRQLIDSYAITGPHSIQVGNVSFTKEDIRLIVDESIPAVLASSMQKNNIVSVVNGVITLASSTAELSVGDKITIEIAIDNVAKEATSQEILEAINNIPETDLSSVAKQGSNANATNTAILEAVSVSPIGLESEVQAGKAAIATAIRQKGGGVVSNDDTFNTLALNISRIPQKLLGDVTVDMSTDNIINQLYGNFQTNVDIARSFKGKFTGYNGYFCVEYLPAAINSDGQTRVTGADAYYFSDGSPLLEAAAQTDVYYHTWDTDNLQDGKIVIVYFYYDEEYECILNNITNAESVVIGGKPTTITNTGSSCGFGIFMLEETELTNCTLANPNAVNIVLLMKKGQISSTKNSITTSILTPKLKESTSTVSGLSMLYNWDLSGLETASAPPFIACPKITTVNYNKFQYGSLPVGTFKKIYAPVATSLSLFNTSTIYDLYAPNCTIIKHGNTTATFQKLPDFFLNMLESIDGTTSVDIGYIYINNCPETMVLKKLNFIYRNVVFYNGCKNLYAPAYVTRTGGYHNVDFAGDDLEYIECANLENVSGQGSYAEFLAATSCTKIKEVICPKANILTNPGYNSGHWMQNKIYWKKLVVNTLNIPGFGTTYRDVMYNCPRLSHIELCGTQNTILRMGNYSPTEAFSTTANDLVEDTNNFSNNKEQWLHNMETLLIDHLEDRTGKSALDFRLPATTIAELGETLIAKINSKNWNIVTV